MDEEAYKDFRQSLEKQVDESGSPEREQTIGLESLGTFHS
jgi:hypothetical protein